MLGVTGMVSMIASGYIIKGMRTITALRVFLVIAVMGAGALIITK